ncbi:hypothetical protein VL12_16085 [Rossellomorea marisflavi]|nr:hypothetical protein VL12_16085 [Rossellomorea marisflavi]
MWLPPFCRLIDGWMVGCEFESGRLMSICDFFLLRVKGMGYLENRMIYQRDTRCDFQLYLHRQIPTYFAGYFREFGPYWGRTGPRVVDLLATFKKIVVTF